MYAYITTSTTSYRRSNNQQLQTFPGDQLPAVQQHFLGVLGQELDVELLEAAQHLLDHLWLGEDGGPVLGTMME